MQHHPTLLNQTLIWSSCCIILFDAEQSLNSVTFNLHIQHLGFSYIQILLKGQLFETSGLYFDNWLFGPEKFSELSRNRPLGPVSRKSRELFGPEKPFVKLRPAYSVKLVFSYVINGIKIKITAMFRASRRLRFEDTKSIMSPEIRPKSFGTFEKRASGLFKASSLPYKLNFKVI